MVTLPIGRKTLALVEKMSPEEKAVWLAEFREAVRIQVEQDAARRAPSNYNGARAADDRAAYAYSNFRSTFGL